mgnify:CR=1 FL=1
MTDGLLDGGLVNMTREQVEDYLENNEVTVGFAYTDEAGETYYSVTTPRGFVTFDPPMTEDQGKYAAVLWHRLIMETGICVGDAERLAASYVVTYVVMQKPMTEEEQEEARQRAISCLKSGNVHFVNGIGEVEEHDHNADAAAEDAARDEADDV